MPSVPARRKISPIAAAAGIVLGVVVAILAVRFFPRATPPLPSTPEALGGALLPEDEGALAEVLFHYVPSLEPVIDRPYRDFLGTLDPSTRLVAIVPRDAPEGALSAFLAKIDATGALERRTRVVEVSGPISVWSKDRALVLTEAASRTELLIPVPPDPRWVERTNDWHTLEDVVRAMPQRFFLHQLPLAFDAGDFAVTGGTVIVDANLAVKNKPHGVETPADLTVLLAKLLGQRIVMLGAADGDVPRHHLSMYMTPLGARRVLVGDPSAALSVVGATYAPGESSPDTGEPLHADFSSPMLARFERAARDLASAGFEVVRIPTVAFDDKTYFAYTNGVYETRGGKKVAWVPQYARDGADPVTALDDSARKIYENEGWEVRRVAVRAAYPFHGTIGCLVNVLARN